MEDTGKSEFGVRMTASPAGPATALQAVGNLEEEFSGGGVVERDFPLTGVPLLGSFYFQYTSGRNLSTQLDHHVQTVLVLPGFPDQGKIELGMTENGNDADYYFKVRHFLADNSRIRRFSRGLDIGQGRNIEIPIERPTGNFIFVLSGFQLSYRGDDHHIDEIGITESDGKVRVRLNDKNDDDSFVFRLFYAYVPRDLIAQLGTARGDGDSDAGGGASMPIPAGTAVIRGFNMDFRSTDHHIRNIGVVTDNRKVEVFFGDKNGDDTYDWVVQWAILAA